MKKTSKALLLSALLLPGSGHWYLKLRLKAVVVFAAAGFCLYTIMAAIQLAASKVMLQIIDGKVGADFLTINQMVHNSPELQSINQYVTAMVIIWLVALVDVYISGKKIERQDAEQTEAAIDSK